MRTANHRIFPLNFDSLQLLEAPRYALSIRFPRGIIVAALLLCVTGCGGGSGGGSGSSGGSATTAPPALASGGAASVYVVEPYYSGSAWGILQLPATANGSVSPTSALILTGTTGTTQFCCIAIDSSGQLYVALQNVVNNVSAPWEVLVYAVGASGSATPMRTILPSFAPSAMAIDSAGSLYLANGSAIAVYANNANGPATPSRTITGPATQIYGEGTLAVDALGNVYTDATIASISTTTPPILTVLEFSSTANGNVAPSRVISVPSGAPTGYSYYYGAIFAIATDTAGNVYLAGYTRPLVLENTYSIIEVAAGSSGTVTPLKTITIESSSTLYLYPGSGLRVDAAGNIYFVAQGTLTFVGAYGPSSSGTQSPAITITSPTWDPIGPVVSSIALK